LADSNNRFLSEPVASPAEPDVFWVLSVRPSYNYTENEFRGTSSWLNIFHLGPKV